jgi:hypothetical protein
MMTRATSRWIYAAVAATALAALAYAPATAHHAFGAEFDADAPLQIEGRVVRLGDPGRC